MADVFAQALAAHRSGQLTEAERFYREVLALDPAHANALTNLGTIYLQRGDWEEGLRFYGLALAIEPSRVDVLYNRGNVRLGQQRMDEALADYDAVIRLSPGHADALCNRAVALRALGRLPEALEACDRALAQRPDHPEAAGARAAVLLELDRWEDALDAYQRACVLAPASAENALQYGVLLWRKRRAEDALAALDRAIALGASASAAHSNRASVLESLGRFDEARLALDRALALDPVCAPALMLKGMLAIMDGDHAAGWTLFEHRWRTEELKAAARDMGKPQWSIDGPTAGRTIMLHAEQGLGDTLQMLRYAPLLARRGARVLACVQQPLADLARMVEGIEGVWALGEPLPAFDLHCPMMSLPFAFGTTAATIPADIPYLAAPEISAAAWRLRLGSGSGLRVGLVWSGSPGHLNDANRSMSLAAMAPLLDLDARFVSLQAQYRETDAALLRSGVAIEDVSPLLTSLGETAALIAALDLVITVDTAVAHLAGAMGKPVWILLAHKPDFRWMLNRADSPWYPTGRLMRQPRPGDWAAVIDEASARLSALIATR